MSKKHEEKTADHPSAQPEIVAPPSHEPPKSIDFVIQGLDFTAQAPYAEGHTITKAEASALNQVRVENLRNNFASRVKASMDKAKEEGRELSDEEKDGLQAAFADYEASYEFQGKRQARTPVDPVKREATKMARETISGALRANGIKLDQLPEGKMDELIEGYLAKHPEVSKEAAARVERMKQAANDALEGVDVSQLAQLPAEEVA